MLDVHPPHHAANTWRDFFIHIATIVVGLLIAVGLEQVVERLHQHCELRETREQLSREQEANRASLDRDERDWLVTTAELKNDLAVLQFIRQHPGTPQTALPGDLQWVQSPFRWNHAVWDSAEKNGIVRLMPLAEANGKQSFYALMSILSDQSLQDWNAINDAHRFDLLDPDPTHLSQAQLNEVIQLTEIALEKHILLGYSFGRCAYEFPELPHAITWRSIERLRPTSVDLDPQGMATAHRRTEDLLKATAPAPEYGRERTATE